MARTTPVRKPHTSTADLLTWPETPHSYSATVGSAASRSAVRSHQPSDGIRKVVFGGQVTDEETESLNKWKPCSEHKMKEITGSGIFTANIEDEVLGADPTQDNRTGLRMYQQAIAGISHISFIEEECISPKKPTTLPEMAKQRELSGNLEREAEAKLKKLLSDAKCKELSGHNIFAPPPEIKPHAVTARTLELKGSIEIGEPASPNAAPQDSVIKTTKKIHNQKFAELSGNNILKGDIPPSSEEKPLSVAKLREMSGSNIFADGKIESRDYLGGVRKPPGGGSSIALV